MKASEGLIDRYKAAAVLGCSDANLLHLERHGVLKPIRVKGQQLMWNEKDVYRLKLSGWKVRSYHRAPKKVKKQRVLNSLAVSPELMSDLKIVAKYHGEKCQDYISTILQEHCLGEFRRILVEDIAK